MKSAPFDYHRPDCAAEAAQMLAEYGDEAKILAGGQSLVPMLALRLAYFDHLIDISRLDELKGTERRDGALWIGATTTDATVGADNGVAAAVPLLTRVTPYIGHFQIRSRGTLGGSIAHADPAGEYPAVALALDAEMEALSPRGRRQIPAGEFFTGDILGNCASRQHVYAGSLGSPVFNPGDRRRGARGGAGKHTSSRKI